MKLLNDDCEKLLHSPSALEHQFKDWWPGVLRLNFPGRSYASTIQSSTNYSKSSMQPQTTIITTLFWVCCTFCLVSQPVRILVHVAAVQHRQQEWATWMSIGSLYSRHKDKVWVFMSVLCLPYRSNSSSVTTSQRFKSTLVYIQLSCSLTVTFFFCCLCKLKVQFNTVHV